MSKSRGESLSPLGRSPLSDIDFAALFQVAPVGLAVLDPHLRYVHCNDFLAEINGIAAGHHLGRTVRELLPELAPEVEPRFHQAFRTGRAQRALKVSGSTPKAPGLRRTFLESVTPLTDPRGEVSHILISVEEITTLEETQAALRESERTLRASQQLSPECFTILRAVRDAAGAVVDFIWEYANPATEAIVRAGPLAERRMLEVFKASRDHPMMFRRYAQMLSTSEVSEVEYAHEHRGVTYWFRDAAVAIDPDRVAVGFRDISAQKRVADQLQLVTGELRHRIKNSIFVIAGLVRREAKFARDVPEFVAALLTRLSSLASAQDLLTADSNSDVALNDIVRAALGPFEARRLVVRPGPDLPVRAGSVTLLAMALHELATNAVKHGALSSPEGSATLSWTVEGERVELDWSETGGPPVSEPSREGFGSQLIAEAAERLPQGALRRTFRPEGLRVSITFNRQGPAAS